MKKKQKKVLVTGASGYLALHCISELLDNGFLVRGSLRDIKKEREEKLGELWEIKLKVIILKFVL